MRKDERRIQVRIINNEVKLIVDLINKENKTAMREIIEYALLNLFTKQQIEKNETYLSVIFSHEVVLALKEKSISTILEYEKDSSLIIDNCKRESATQPMNKNNSHNDCTHFPM